MLSRLVHERHDLFQGLQVLMYLRTLVFAWNP